MVNQAKPKLIDFQIFKQLKTNHYLIPIVFLSFLGVGMGVFEAVRTLIKSPDVIIDRRKDPQPWNKLETDDGKYVQYKYVSTLDYKDLAKSDEKPRIV